MKIVIIVEGKTEKAFMPSLRAYLEKFLPGRMPKLNVHIYNGRIPKKEKLKRVVKNLLSGNDPADFVIALTDVYTRNNDFEDATDAKIKMSAWVGEKEQRFFPHVAQHDFEAWLLPYWSTIQRLTKQNTVAPAGNPETVNHMKPPSYHIQKMYNRNDQRYSKPVEALRILRNKDLSIAVEQCSELKAFVDRIISLCNAQS